MFDSVGWGEILVLIVAGLFILGPERLPVGRGLGRQDASARCKEYAAGAREQLRGELGPEFDELRKPLEDLRGLRDFNPRTAAPPCTCSTTGRPTKPNGFAGDTNGSTGANGSSTATPQKHPATGPAPEQLARDERPPIDPDAT